jgi:hypothetical protein
MILNKRLEFIKMHMQSHALVDTVQFGPTRHFTTTTGEKGHVILHHDFARTDGRNSNKKVYSNSSLIQVSLCTKLIKLGDERAMFQLIRSRERK